MPFPVPTTIAHSTIHSTPATGRPESVVLALKVMAVVFAVVIFGLLGLIVVWNQWRCRIARRNAPPAEESGNDEKEYDEATMEDEESIQGIPELAHKIKTIPAQRSKDYEHKLAVLIATIKFWKQREARKAQAASCSQPPPVPSSFTTGPSLPLPSAKKGNVPHTQPTPNRPSRWNRYTPRIPSPLGSGLHRGPGPLRHPTWRRLGQSTTSNSKELLRYASRPRQAASRI